MKIAAALLLLLATSVHASSLDQLREFLQNVKSIQANFDQAVYDKNSKLVQQSHGRMQFLRPGKFRWQYEQPYSQLIIGDGSKVWLYDRDLNQVTVKKLNQAFGASPAALLAGDREIEKTFTLSDAGRHAELDWVEAIPKDEDSTFDKVLIGFSSSSLEKLEMYDRLGHLTKINFLNVQWNPKLGIETFTFEPPTGVDIIGD